MIYHHRMTDTEHLKRVLNDCWAQLSQDILNRAIDQLPKKLSMFIKANGRHVGFVLDQQLAGLMLCLWNKISMFSGILLCFWCISGFFASYARNQWQDWVKTTGSGTGRSGWPSALLRVCWALVAVHCSLLDLPSCPLKPVRWWLPRILPDPDFTCMGRQSQLTMLHVKRLPRATGEIFMQQVVLAYMVYQ